MFTELSSGLTLIRVRVGVVLFLLGSQSSAGAVRAETVASSSVPVRVRVSSPVSSVFVYQGKEGARYCTKEERLPVAIGRLAGVQRDRVR